MNRRDDFSQNGESHDGGAQAGGAEDREMNLSAADRRVLDALVQVGFARGRLPEALDRMTPEDQRRAAAMTRLLGVLDDYPVEDAEPALLHATLARIDRHEDQLAARMQFDARKELAGGGGGSGRRIRIPDFISVAAVLLIVAGVMWPVLDGVRQRSIDAACANNMRRLALSFSDYSADNNGSMPMAMAGPMGTWDTVKNVINLKPLVDQGYCEAGHLNCPGHHLHSDAESAGAPSYSYRWFTPQGAAHWNGPRVTIILGDLNPLIDAARRGWPAPPLSVSVNHGGRGQNVLASDGQTIWLTDPVIGRGDNIWMPDNADSLTPGSSPVDGDDVFLAH
jgi:hypothetical protein